MLNAARQFRLYRHSIYTLLTKQHINSDSATSSARISQTGQLSSPLYLQQEIEYLQVWCGNISICTQGGYNGLESWPVWLILADLESLVRCFLVQTSGASLV